MSRGFVKEDDQEEPPFIPPRAFLPDGVENYVTETGMELLQDELTALIASRKNVSKEDDRERRREVTVIDGKISLLEERIQSAKITAPEASTNEVRFGTTVSYAIGSQSKEHTFSIVGVDEADIKLGKVSFIAPIVQQMMGRKVGDEFEFALGGKPTMISITRITPLQ